MWTLILLLPMLAIAQEGSGSIEQRYNRLVEVDDSTFGNPEPERNRSLEAAYVDLFEDGSHDRRRVDDHDLTLLFRAAQRIHFYTHKSKYEEEMARYLDVMESRGIATPVNRLDYYRSLIAERRFGDAERYAQSANISPNDRVPAIRTSPDEFIGSPAVLEVVSDGQSLRIHQLRVEDMSVVVVVTPWCHFARHGLGAISLNPEIAQALKGRVIWLMPVEGNLDVGAVRQWNAEHPEQSMVYAYKKEGWSMLPDWGTPTFYFFKRGRVVAQQVGWRSDAEGVAALRGNLKKIGLME